MEIPDSAPVLEPQRGRETILLVEDEAALLEVVETVLSSHGFHVLAATNGPEALRLWDRHKAEIALLFTDIVMPHHLSGVDIADRFGREKPELKIIFTSGHQLDVIPAGSEIRKRGLFIPKPYVPSALANLIRQVLDE